ncbi:hypothetical protein CAP35_12250 [Chitinophagaceae bacterium IBVUCB1]|nr:hypothetical protein CAP35_12250 [Chitinophagaceae bacterium IBVUCB1]
MRHLLYIFLLIAGCLPARAQDVHNPLIPPADRVWRSYQILEKNKLAIIQQLDFINNFPKTKDDFVAVFDPDDRKQLHYVYDTYLTALEEAGKVLPDSVLKTGIGICKQMKWASGVSDRLQHVVLVVAADNPEIFVEQAYKLKRKELEALIQYLADVESNPLCAIYQKLLKNLHDAGAYNIEGMLLRARGSGH